ncbi:MAG: D-alanyl-D-alanine carboxypeptidase [Candidatus Andeanibacterium colombiense]|uniref:serine-type D-Ala-D-Ala carboxypeptidase n=1 Tax=Candidatus Andeanibacterium colombiense TaxID=3121345 RepID=A0AAJ6BPU2_9SPHN|nr:MAG: D-alanyl-D-alanine carboxypeptidase [Sphingomonadaceae bacterium]
MLTLPAGLHADAAAPSDSAAPVALLIDLSSGQTLHARDIDRRFLPASVTKVMTTYVAFEMLAKGRLKPETQYVVSDRLAREWSGKGSSLFLKAGERVSIDTLLHGITTVSANDGAMLLAEGTAGSAGKWTALMNRAAGDLGMHDSHFGTPNGWPDEGATYTTARDLATLARALITRHPDLYRRYFGKRSFGHDGIGQDNHDPITGVVPGADGIKTGFTREAGYNFLGSAQRGGQRLVMVVAGVDSDELRARISRDYLEWGFGAFEPKVIFAKGSPMGKALVQDGATGSVKLRAGADIVADLPKMVKPQVTLRMHYRGPLRAPIKAGQPVAALEIRIAGFAPYEVPLEAAENIPRANILQRIRNGVLGWLS